MLNTCSIRRLILFVIVLLFAALLHSQDERHYNFIHYPAESGIISYQVNTAVQDDEGYMWFGTTNGLQRFDGIRFKTFRHEEKNRLSLPSNPVWQLMVDKKKNLWLLLSDGRVGIFDTHNFIFKEVQARFKGIGSPNTSLKRLLTDEEGNIFYIISGSEVITYNEKASEFSYTNNFFKQKDDWRILDFIQQPGTAKYWLSVENGGIAIYNKSTGALSYSGNNTGKEKAIDAFDKTKSYYNLFFDQQNRLWTVQFGAHPMVSCYNTKINSYIVKDISLYPMMKTYFEIKRFTQQKDGTIWMHGLFLLARFSEEEKKIQIVHNGYENEHSISYEMVHCLYEDKENNVWVCTDNNGLYRFNPSREFFTNIDHINRVTDKKGDGNILSFMHTRWNSLLVSTWNDGLYEYDQNFNPVAVKIKGLDNKDGPFIWSMVGSADSNTLWMGAEPGFYAVNQLQKSSRYFNPPVLANSTVRQIVEDKKGNLWLGTQSKGLFKCIISKENNPVIKSITAVNAVPSVQINKITIDAQGMIWVGTPENGLYVLDGLTDKLLKHFGEKEEKEKNLPERGISSVLQYSDSIILISTATRLVKYNNSTKETRVIGNPGFISGFITAMEKDSQGNVWLTSTSGLYRIDIQKKVFILYDRSDGLDNEHFIQSASHVLPDGKIFFGATHNFVFFDPGKMRGLPFIPVVKITGIKLENKSLNVDSVLALKELGLGYNDKSLIIEFSPLLFGSINMVKYKAEGLDKDWITTDKTFQAIYNYLPPGTYNFRIKPADDMSNKPDGIFMLKIKVESPFWKTVWFYCLVALFGLSLLFWLDRERLARKEAVEKMRSAIADDLHEEINTALENINILSEMARLKADHEPEKSKEFIEQINSKSHSMIIAMDDMLWSISPENDSMEKTVLRLKEFVDGLKNRHGVQIDLLVDENVKSLPLNMKQRKDIFWFFKGGISNVVRTGGTDCRLHIMYEKPNLLYTLEFDTSNTNMQQLNNLRQRKELADRLSAVHAKLEVKELKTKTIFVLTIPVNN